MLITRRCGRKSHAMDVMLISLSETIAEWTMGATAYRAMPMKGRIGAEPSFFFPKSWRATEVKRRQTTMRWVALRRGWQGKVLASTRRLLENSENRIPA